VKSSPLSKSCNYFDDKEVNRDNKCPSISKGDTPSVKELKAKNSMCCRMLLGYDRCSNIIITRAKYTLYSFN